MNNLEAILISRQRKQLQRTLAINSAYAILYIGAAYFDMVPFESFLLAVPLLIPGLVWLRNAVTRHRVNRGYFGNNESECRELLRIAEELNRD